jgi:hypothetical protein
MDADTREQLVQNALRVIRLRNIDRYNVDDVNEPYIRSLNDTLLGYIVERDGVVDDTAV